jgi:hypothetical protein
MAEYYVVAHSIVIYHHVALPGVHIVQNFLLSIFFSVSYEDFPN